MRVGVGSEDWGHIFMAKFVNMFLPMSLSNIVKLQVIIPINVLQLQHQYLCFIPDSSVDPPAVRI